MPRLKFYVGLFLITSSTLMLQLIETRIFSVIVWYYLAFFAISIAMFGLTAGAVWVYLQGERFSQKTLSHDLSYFSTAFGLATVLSLVMQLSLPLVHAFSATVILVWFLLAIFIAIPYFFSGVVVSLALTRSPFLIGRVYGVDLLGAAIGCIGVLVLLNHSDGPTAVLWVASIITLGAICFEGSKIGGINAQPLPFTRLLQHRTAIFLTLILLAVINNSLTSHGLQPLIVKDKIERRSSSLIYEKWNSFSRITANHLQILENPQIWGPSPKMPKFLTDQIHLQIDGCAGTTMYKFTGDIEAVDFFKYDITNLGYFLPDKKRVAIIGVGGGRDLLSAWVFGSRDVSGIEINPVFINLLTHEPGFVEFAGLKNLPGMRFVIDEARSWFARSHEQFDLIQMSLIDTWAATGAGAFTLSENGLYTTEAWRIFLNHLTPHGVFTLSRWYAPGEVNETGRMISLAVATLLESGVEEPARHIFVAGTSNIATLILSRAPIAAKDIKELEKIVGDFQYITLISPSSEPKSPVLRNIVQAKNRQQLEEVTQGFDLDLTPPTDNRPFFFNQLRLFDLSMIEKLLKNLPEGGVGAGNLLATRTLFLIFLLSFALVVSSIIIPLRSAVKDIGSKLVLGGTAYFFLIGVGFMVVEISLLQRMSVFLGHPIYSLSVVLFSLILTTGLGSLVSDRFQLNSAAKFVIWSGLTAGYLMSLPLWLSGTLLAFDSADLLTRCTLCVVMIAPAGLLMGFGFPTGMRLVAVIDPKPTPWFWGINGAAGVLAASLAVGCSIASGVNVALAIGGVCYALLIPAGLIMGFPKAINS
jgi:hypothetical protein